MVGNTWGANELVSVVDQKAVGKYRGEATIHLKAKARRSQVPTGLVRREDHILGESRPL